MNKIQLKDLLQKLYPNQLKKRAQILGYLKSFTTLVNPALTFTTANDELNECQLNLKMLKQFSNSELTKNAKYLRQRINNIKQFKNKHLKHSNDIYYIETNDETNRLYRNYLTKTFVKQVIKNALD